ncbi:MAG: hypothetical protein KVP17_002374 [Porospora cf. gigantea B]|uniref:uncharacterized protein n=1 Tax=Porospora cf. gigantea B TaxID=2853592 RepID=UPI003571CD19|nr:MAG: hypothetical protein KVP17_002374 [Porospora cf. gigantea B]
MEFRDHRTSQRRRQKRVEQSANRFLQHWGVRATRIIVRHYLYWPGLDIQGRTCPVCATQRPPVRRQLKQVLKEPILFEMMSLDFVGPRDIDVKDKHYLVCITAPDLSAL